MQESIFVCVNLQRSIYGEIETKKDLGTYKEREQEIKGVTERERAQHTTWL